MQRKELLLSGFVLTAFLAALVLSGMLPAWAVAFILVGAGLLLTFLAALAMQNRQDAMDTQELLSLLVRLEKSASPEELMEQLLLGVRRMSAAEDCRILPTGQQPDGKRPMPVPHESGTETDPAGTGDEPREHPPGVVLPLRLAGEPAAALWLGGLPPSGQLSDWNRRRIETFIAAAERLWTRRKEEQSRQDYLKRLLLRAVTAHELRQDDFRGHGRRVAMIAVLLGRQLGLKDRELADLYYAALLHDIGRTYEEGADQGHPDRGADVFKGEDDYKTMAEAIRFHHERYDGSGFPQGLRATGIPFAARILAVADLYDGLTRLAPAEQRLPHEAACQAIRKATGSLFDPLVVVALQEAAQEIGQQLAEADAGDAEIKETPANDDT